MQRNQKVGALLGAGAVALITAGVARGIAPSDSHRPSPRSSGDRTLAMTRFYESSTARIGDFPGKLVCLRDDLESRAAAVTRCEQDSHHHALSMDDGAMMHSLLIGNEEVRQRIHSGA